MTLTRVVLADDHKLVRAGIRKLLESFDDVVVVGEANSGLELLKLVDELLPDLVLMDITMPDMDGLDATLEIQKRRPAVRVIILSMYENEEYVALALKHGAIGYLLKDAAPTELRDAIAAALAGNIYLSPSVSQDVIDVQARYLKQASHAAPVLSRRQHEVLLLIVQGLSNKDIARQLSISTKTVETHRARLMEQLDIHDVAGLVRYAMRTGLVAPR